MPGEQGVSFESLESRERLDCLLAVVVEEGSRDRRPHIPAEYVDGDQGVTGDEETIAQLEHTVAAGVSWDGQRSWSSWDIDQFTIIEGRGLQHRRCARQPIPEHMSDRLQHCGSPHRCLRDSGLGGEVGSIDVVDPDRPTGLPAYPLSHTPMVGVVVGEDLRFDRGEVPTSFGEEYRQLPEVAGEGPVDQREAAALLEQVKRSEPGSQPKNTRAKFEHGEASGIVHLVGDHNKTWYRRARHGGV